MLPAIMTQLEQLIVQIKASGPVADATARLDVSTHATSGYDYGRLRTGSVLKSCGRVGSDPYLEVLATLQRRDKIAQLRQAITALTLADEIPVAGVELAQLPENAPATSQAKAKPAPAARKKKTKGRKQLYTHVKTRQGSVTHAVLGKDRAGEWRTAALCGATPPKRDRMGWDFPTHGDGVTCPKCYRKLPANGKRHLPSLG